MIKKIMYLIIFIGVFTIVLGNLLPSTEVNAGSIDWDTQSEIVFPWVQIDDIISCDGKLFMTYGTTGNCADFQYNDSTLNISKEYAISYSTTDSDDFKYQYLSDIVSDFNNIGMCVSYASNDPVNLAITNICNNTLWGFIKTDNEYLLKNTDFFKEYLEKVYGSYNNEGDVYDKIYKDSNSDDDKLVYSVLYLESDDNYPKNGFNTVDDGSKAAHILTCYLSPFGFFKYKASGLVYEQSAERACYICNFTSYNFIIPPSCVDGNMSSTATLNDNSDFKSAIIENLESLLNDEEFFNKLLENIPTQYCNASTRVELGKLISSYDNFELDITKSSITLMEYINEPVLKCNRNSIFNWLTYSCTTDKNNNTIIKPEIYANYAGEVTYHDVQNGKSHQFYFKDKYSQIDLGTSGITYNDDVAGSFGIVTQKSNTGNYHLASKLGADLLSGFILRYSSFPSNTGYTRNELTGLIRYASKLRETMIATITASNTVSQMLNQFSCIDGSLSIDIRGLTDQSDIYGTNFYQKDWVSNSSTIKVTTYSDLWLVTLLALQFDKSIKFVGSQGTINTMDTGEIVYVINGVKSLQWTDKTQFADIYCNKFVTIGRLLTQIQRLNSDSFKSSFYVFFNDINKNLLKNDTLIKIAISLGISNMSYRPLDDTGDSVKDFENVFGSIDIEVDFSQKLQPYIESHSADLFVDTLQARAVHSYYYVLYSIASDFYTFNTDAGGGSSGVDSYLPFATLIQLSYAAEYPNDMFIIQNPVGISNPLIFGENANKALQEIALAFTVLDWSSFADANQSDVDSLKDYFTGSGNGSAIVSMIENFMQVTPNATAYDFETSGVYDNLTDMQIALLRCINNLHHTTQSFNIKHWTATIDRYLELYDMLPIEFWEAFDKCDVKLLSNLGDGTNSIANPFGNLMDADSNKWSKNWMTGRAISSLYIPLSTNMYTEDAVNYKTGSSWLEKYYCVYGFYRKALYVSQDPNVLINNVVTSSEAAASNKAATLRDLLDCDRDIQLYVDTGFYNADDLMQYILQYNGYSNVESVGDSITIAGSNLLRINGQTQYSSEIAQKVTPLGEAPQEEFVLDGILLDQDSILDPTTMSLLDFSYSLKSQYAIISAIYRSPTYFNLCNRDSIASDVVFSSSRNISNINGISDIAASSLYNYIYLSTLQNMMNSQTMVTFDLDSPLFIDISGNIVTNSGYVVIPAAANATLMGQSFTPYTIPYAYAMQHANSEAFNSLPNSAKTKLTGIDFESYQNGLPKTKSVSDYWGHFSVNQNNQWSLKLTTISDGVASLQVDWNMFNRNTKLLKDLVYSITYQSSGNTFNSTNRKIVFETLRGAPIDQIDFGKEKILVGKNDTASVYFGSKIDKFLSNIETSSDGTRLSSGFGITADSLDIFRIVPADKLALIAVKVLLVVLIAILAINIVVEATQGNMPLKTVGNIIYACVMLGLAITSLPLLNNFTITKLSQALTQQECSELLLLSSARTEGSTEIGIDHMQLMDSDTDIVVHAGEISTHWYDALLYSLYAGLDGSYEEIYSRAAEKNQLANASYTLRRDKEIYLDLNRIFETTSITYDTTNHILYHGKSSVQAPDTYSLSSMLPYYVFLDQLVNNVNKYNKDNSILPLNGTVLSNGNLTTHDLVTGYLHSPEFNEDMYDILGLYQILDVTSTRPSYIASFSEDDIMKMQFSKWYPNSIDDTFTTELIADLYNEVRAFCGSIDASFGCLSDAAILKSIAMFAAVRYNKYFNVGFCDAFEMQCVDSTDLLRFVISTPDGVYRYANRTFTRYALDTNGFPAVILGCILYLVYALADALKILVYLLSFVYAVYHTIKRMLIDKDKEAGQAGFYTLIAKIALINTIYVLIVKVEINLTRWGIPPIWALVISIIMLIGVTVLYTTCIVRTIKEFPLARPTSVQAIEHFFSNIQNHINNVNNNSKVVADDAPQTKAQLVAYDYSRRQQDEYSENSVNDLVRRDEERYATDTK